MYENTTVLDRELLKVARRIYHYQVKKFSLTSFLVFALLGVIMYMLSLKILAIILITISIIFPLLFHVIIPFIGKSKIKTENDNQILQSKPICEFIFNDEKIIFNVKNIDSESDKYKEINYVNINQVYKFKKYLVFLTDSNEIFTLSNKGMTKRTILDVHNLLKLKSKK
jgi:hypothetical protein